MAKKSNNKNSKKTAVKKENQKKVVNNSRVTRNKELYDEDLTITKQQQFDFKSLHLENTIDLDTSFVEKKTKQKTQSETKQQELQNKTSSKQHESIKKPIIQQNKKNKFYKTVVLILSISLIILIILISFHFITFNHNKVKIVTKTVEKVVNDENIVFLGDSLTYRYNLEKYFDKHNIVNSGIDGNKTTDILEDMKNRVYQYNPSKIILLIGTNDLDESTELSVEEVFNNIKKICQEINENKSHTSICVESLLPVNEDVIDSPAKNKSNEEINEINKLLKEYCKKKGYTYINTHDQLLDEDFHLGLKYTKDGLHLNDDGYKVISEIIEKYL